MTMFKLLGIRILIAYILVMVINGEVYEFQMLFGIWGTTLLALGRYILILNVHIGQTTGTARRDIPQTGTRTPDPCIGTV